MLEFKKRANYSPLPADTLTLFKIRFRCLTRRFYEINCCTQSYRWIRNNVIPALWTRCNVKQCVIDYFRIDRKCKQYIGSRDGKQRQVAATVPPDE